jgi:hypothetical protein
MDLSTCRIDRLLEIGESTALEAGAWQPKRRLGRAGANR